jgi:predicted nucleic acid-binding protein
MIVLDTNIISEMMKSAPAPNVAAWIDQQLITQLYVTTITIAEIRYGLCVLPKGSRRDSLKKAFERVIEAAFQGRVLSFDEPAAHFYGEIMGVRKELGRPLSIPDGQIASVARAQDAALATRNTRDFKDCGLELINPFEGVG